jgi:hypothetical protein
MRFTQRTTCAFLFIVLSAVGQLGFGQNQHTKAPRKEPVSASLPGAAFAALQTIDPEHIRWHVRFLSQDVLQLGGAAQGGGIAAEYIATQFAEYGLKPGGDNNSYFQKAHIAGQIRSFESNNVVAILPGSDRKLREEAVLYTAHFATSFATSDGNTAENGVGGTTLPTSGDATGCGILLELARAFSVAREHPRRSIIFAVLIEEPGPVAAEYLASHLPVGTGKISLDLNYDIVKPLGAPQEVRVDGAERTTFYPWVQATAKLFRLAIRPDAPSELRPSHDLAMGNLGIPAFSINEGMKFKGHPETWGIAKNKELVQASYSENDSHPPTVDFVGDAAMARFGFALGWEAANLLHLIAWEK